MKCFLLPVRTVTYTNHPEVTIDKRSLAWLRAHAHYDDLHPYEAMEPYSSRPKLIHNIAALLQQHEMLFAASQDGHYISVVYSGV
jgi:hypothetical protein